MSELADRHLTAWVLIMGQAASVFSDQKKVFQLNAFGPLTENELNDRRYQLDKATLDHIVTQLRPKIVVAGMSHAIQAQLTNHFKAAGATTLAFYDNLELMSRSQYVVPWLDTIKGVDELLVPGSYQVTDAKQFPVFANSHIFVSGNPALEQWDPVFQATNRAGERQRLALDPKRPVILFTGGYSDEYEQWLQLFLQAVAECPELQVLIAPHPKTAGQLERNAVAKLRLPNVSVGDGSLSCAQMATVADLVVTHKSTTGFQAAWEGLPVVFVAPQDYTNILIDAGLAGRASSRSQIINMIQSEVEHPKQRGKVPFNKQGVPEHSLQRIADHLQILHYQ
ncbi:MAG: hypothetical protein LPH21_11350 [Shewanella sp.]|nr:hypothetical protein [Shewanella sp.]